MAEISENTLHYCTDITAMKSEPRNTQGQLIIWANFIALLNPVSQITNMPKGALQPSAYSCLRPSIKLRGNVAAFLDPQK